MSSAEERSQPAARPRVLVIEDAAPLRIIAVHMLKRDFDVEQAATAEEAMELLEARRYDAVLTDINLGGPLNGIDILHAFRRSHPDAGTPFIAVTTHSPLQGREHYLEQGFHDFVAKPFTQQGLAAAVLGVLEKRG